MLLQRDYGMQWVISQANSKLPPRSSTLNTGTHLLSCACDHWQAIMRCELAHYVQRQATNACLCPSSEGAGDKGRKKG
jgi:hypothetical protein